MAKIKNWMLEMEHHVYMALDTTPDMGFPEVINFVAKQMEHPIDIRYIEKLYNEYHVYESVVENLKYNCSS